MKKLILFLLALLGFASCHEVDEYIGGGRVGGEIRPMYGVTPVEFQPKSKVINDSISGIKEISEQDESR